MGSYNSLSRFIRIRYALIFFCAATLAILTCFLQVAYGQIPVSGLTGAPQSTIQTSVPFLTIAPDARSSGMGDIGVASMPDANSQHWNAAKYVFAEKRGGGAFSFTPWQTNVTSNINHYYLAGYYKLNEKSALSSSIRYFTMPTIVFSSVGSTNTSELNPYELAVDAGYSRKFTDRLSGGLVLRYIHSDLVPSGEESHPGRSVAGDIGLYYQRDIQPWGLEGQWATGLSISNLGSPVSYYEDAETTPIPTNMRLGGRYSISIGEDHGISILADLNKLLVPTSGMYELDTLSNELILLRGKETPSSVIRGMYQSFYDAPGVQRTDGSYSVFAEEIHEISCALGAAYDYRDLFSLRAGYFHEHASKGNRRYYTFGAGTSFSFLTFDISYLLPVDGQYSPLYNTFRFSLSAGFGSLD
jgi:Type IX secretion system protein PorV